jgi:hypothetical protein
MKKRYSRKGRNQNQKRDSRKGRNQNQKGKCFYCVKVRQCKGYVEKENIIYPVQYQTVLLAIT